MKLSKTEIEIAKQNKSDFVSLKYLGDDGVLKQIDTSITNFKQNDFIIYNDEINLKPIKNKNFIDPFRSFPTTSFFCENIASKQNSRELAIKLLNKSNTEPTLSLSAEISFWGPEENSQDNYKFLADPLDKYANLRSDIISTLESINIKTGAHFHGPTQAESIVSIKGNDLVDLSDNIIITKFIIANITNSYGLNAQFNVPNKAIPNISLIVQSNTEYITELLQNLKPKTKNTSITGTKNNTYNFETDKIYLHQTNTALKISLKLDKMLSPYLAFGELLL